MASVKFLAPVDGNWERLARRLALSLGQGIVVASFYEASLADDPVPDMRNFCRNFIIEAQAALGDD